MDLILLGSGNAATQFGHALKRAGHRIVLVYSHTPSHAETLANALDCPFTADLAEIAHLHADAVLSALKDSVAADVWRRLDFGDTPVFHTAGSLPMAALAPFAKHYGVLYPLQTLSKARLLDFCHLPLFIEAESPETESVLKTIAISISDNVHHADSEQRKAIHLAAVFANNFSNHMFALADMLLKEKNIPFDVLLPIIDETARKVHEMPPADAQTGPAVRYDENVIRQHLERLKIHPDVAVVYELISRSIHAGFSGKN